MSVMNGFINISINRLNDMPVNIAFSIRKPGASVETGKTFSFVIKEINRKAGWVLDSKYDTGTLPDLEQAVFQL